MSGIGFVMFLVKFVYRHILLDTRVYVDGTIASKRLVEPYFIISIGVVFPVSDFSRDPKTLKTKPKVRML